MIRAMKNTILVVVAALALSSCSLMPVTTISRSELLTPTAMTAMDPSTYTGMMYYGADDTYDYFTRNSLKYRVLRTENAMPAAGRFTFDNWQTGKLYSQAAAQGALQGAANGGLQNFFNKFRAAQ